MEKKDMILRLEQLKKDATEIGHAYLQTQLPLKLGKELNDTLKPFISIEKGCYKAIKLINEKL